MITTPPLTTALIYTRVSSDEQKREGLSLDVQLDECRRYAARPGWVIGAEFQDVFSGTRDDRRDYQTLLAEVRRLRTAGRPVVVVVARLDRFGRRLLERVQRREEFKALGVAVHSVREGEVNDMMAGFLALIAEDEVRRLGERVADSRQYVAAHGWRPVGTCPWGYRWRPAIEDERALGAPKMVLEIDDETAPYVRRAFEMVAAGESIRAVMRWVAALPSEARGRRRRTVPARERMLGHNAVQKLLRMPVYAGRRERPDGGDVLSDPPQRWPALIDDVTWANVQQRIGNHKRMPHQASGSYLLTGLIRCPLCDGRMSGWQAGRRSARYRCGRKEWRCNGDAMASPVDAAVLAEVGALVAILVSKDPELRSALRREWRALQQPSGHAALAARTAQTLERAAVKARQRLTDAAVLLVDGTIDKAGYELLRDKESADLEAVETGLARLRDSAPAPTLPPLDDVLRDVVDWAAALRDADVPALRELLGVLIEGVLPERRGLARYDARITWTAAGGALRQVASVLAEAA